MPDAPCRAVPFQPQLGAFPAFSADARPVKPGIDPVVKFIEVASTDAFRLQDIEDTVTVIFRQRAATEEIWQLRVSRNEVAAHIGFRVWLG